MKFDDSKLQLLKSSLAAASSSLELARNILDQLDGVAVSKSVSTRQKPLKPLVTGLFDGKSVKLSDGRVFDVAPNYAAKQVIVYGDEMKLDRIDKRGRAYFRQHKRVKRLREDGVLAKKDGKWVVVSSSGSHKVLPAAVERWGAKEGDECSVFLPADNPMAPFAAIDKVVGRELVEEPEKKPVEEKESEDKKPASGKKSVGNKGSEKVNEKEEAKAPKAEGKKRQPAKKEVVKKGAATVKAKKSAKKDDEKVNEKEVVVEEDDLR